MAVLESVNGVIPNNPKLPLVLYRSPVQLSGKFDPAVVLEKLFERNGWGDSWRNGIYDYAHYHSQIHEVLGVARGHARVRFGGAKGRALKLKAGDVAILPAGTGHERLSGSTVALTNELVLICEGLADKAFFKALLKSRSMPEFDVPFPEDRAELDQGKEPLGGINNFDQMLRNIRVSLGFRRTKGVLIVADSGDEAGQKFEQVCAKIRQVPEYSVPNELLVPSLAIASSPPVAVMLIPDEQTPGGIETLYVREIIQSRDWMPKCVETYLSCEQIKALDWAPEKRDKAKFHSMIAALYEDDPSRSASMIWKKRGVPLLMDINAPVFDNVVDRIRAFCAAVGVA